MEGMCYFSRVPIEVACMILKYLEEDDKMALKFAYPHHFFRQGRHVNVRENFAFGKYNIAHILQLHYNPDMIIKVDFNFCYWISGQEISKFVRRCTNLKELAVAHSNISNEDLADILYKNENISCLSFSLQGPENLWSIEEHAVTCLNFVEHSSKGINGTLWEDLLSLSFYGKCKKTLAHLKTLDFHLGSHPLVLATLLSACKYLENLTIRLDEESDTPEDLKFRQLRSDASNVISSLLRASNTQDHPECWNPFTPRTLKSFALQHNSRDKNKSLDPEMKGFIQQIAERNSSHLQCWWAPIPFMPVNVNGFRWKKMIAWKESMSFGSGVPLHMQYSSGHMQAMESLACNNYMQQTIFRSSKLKQIECGFSLEGSLWFFSRFCRAHPLLERVRFNKRPAYTTVLELENVIEWRWLPRIKALSLHSTIVSDYDKKSEWNKMLPALLKTCPLLEELEICPDFLQSRRSSTRDIGESLIEADSFCGLRVCTNLKKLLLNSLTISYKRSQVNDPSFLEEIVAKCPNIEALYIQDFSVTLLDTDYLKDNPGVMNTLYNDCILQCCLALRSARKLRILRFKLHFVAPKTLYATFRLLTYCPSLQQLGVLANDSETAYSWNAEEEEFTSFFASMVEHLPKLIALLVVLPAASESICVAATRALEVKFRPTRPCFCVQITNSLDNPNPPSLPLVHYRALAHDPHPVGELPFHLIPQDQRY